jgi:cytochrome c-type biogenesis protein CcmH
MKHLIVAMVLGLALASSTQAGVDTREFADSSLRQRYQDLSLVLRCPKCQNQNIAESNSPIANDLRGEIHRMLREGQSDEQIVGFMVARYGDFVLYAPRLSPRTALLWFGPGALLLAGGLALAVFVANRRRTRPTQAELLSDADRHRLARLLQDSATSIEHKT